MEIPFDNTASIVDSDSFSIELNNSSRSHTSNQVNSSQVIPSSGLSSLQNQFYINTSASIQNVTSSPLSLTHYDCPTKFSSLSSKVSSLQHITVFYIQQEIIIPKDVQYQELQSKNLLLESKVSEYEEEIQSLTRELWSNSKRSDLDMSSILERTRDSDGSMFLRDAEITKLRKETHEAFEKALIQKEKECEKLETVRKYLENTQSTREA